MAPTREVTHGKHEMNLVVPEFDLRIFQGSVGISEAQLDGAVRKQVAVMGLEIDGPVSANRRDFQIASLSF